MKKSLVWIVLMAVVMTMNSCGDDPAPIPAVVGTWTLNTYKLVDLPTGFTSYENYETDMLYRIEAGYTLKVNADGTYTRSVKMCCGRVSLSDQGTWNFDESAGTFKLSPDDAEDLDIIDYYGTIGTDFNIVGTVSDIRMTFEMPFNFFLLPDNFPEEQEPVDADFKSVDFSLQLVFDKL